VLSYSEMITRSKAFRSIAETIIPEVRELDDEQWSGVVAIIERALMNRPAKMRRQFALFVRALNVLAMVKYGRSLSALIPYMRTDFLESIQDSRVLLLRRGFWGLRTLILMGYYARPEAMPLIGYRANNRGWQGIA
jgi:hypothetical protein